MKNNRSSSQYGQFLLVYFTVIGMWMCSEAVAKVCWIGNEPDQSGRMQFVLWEKDPCSCTKIRLGGVNMVATGPHHHGHGSKPLYFNRPVMTENADEVAQLLNCYAVDAERQECVSFNTSGYHYNYKFAALPKSTDGAVRVEFSARAPKDVHISLVQLNEDPADKVMYEIVIGGWGDKRSVIRREKQGNTNVSVKNPSGWLDKNTYKDIWVSAVPGNKTLNISVGNGSDTAAFMTYEDHNPISVINYLGFGMHGSVSGTFKFCDLALRPDNV